MEREKNIIQSKLRWEYKGKIKQEKTGNLIDDLSQSKPTDDRNKSISTIDVKKLIVEVKW